MIIASGKKCHTELHIMLVSGVKVGLSRLQKIGVKSLSFLNSTDGSTAPSAIDPTRLETPKSTGVDLLESTRRSNRQNTFDAKRRRQ